VEPTTRPADPHVLEAAARALARSTELQSRTAEAMTTAQHLRAEAARQRPGHVQALRDEIAGLRRAIETRAVIEQAKGVLMAKLGCDSDGAFDHLRRQSQQENRRLREVAAEIVEAAQRRRD